MYYALRTIRSFGDKRAAALFDGDSHKRWKAYDSIADVALRKLDMLDAAVLLDDLRVPPGIRPEALAGDRWRICFVREDAAARQVEIVDYH